MLLLSLILPRNANAAPDPEAPSPNGPNVVLIVADDLGIAEVGYTYAAEGVRTPHIDSIAAEGVRFTAGYAADPMCWPSRATILTGKYHQRFESVQPLPEDERTIGHRMRASGFATACIGKWHNTGSIGVWDGRPVNHPSWWGFDEFFGFLGAAHDYLEADVGKRRIRRSIRPVYMPMYEGIQPVHEMRYQTEELAERAVKFLRRNAAHPWPFFLYLPFGAIHGPEQAPPGREHLRGDEIRLAMIEALDDGVGRVLTELDALGLRDSTLIWFVSDNGGHRDASNGPLRGGKKSLFEGGIRVPFLLRWPGHVPAGSTFDEPVMHADLLPTTLVATGLPLPSDLDGVDLLPHLRGARDTPPHEALFFGDLGAQASFAVRRGPWKLVHEAAAPRGIKETRLFHLGEDIGEKLDRLADEPAIAEELRALHRDWAARMASRERVGPHRRR